MYETRDVSHLTLKADSDVVREQVIRINLDSIDIAENVDTVRLAVMTSRGRVRSMVFRRDQVVF
jgi:hypothetical protein